MALAVASRLATSNATASADPPLATMRRAIASASPRRRLACTTTWLPGLRQLRANRRSDRAAAAGDERAFHAVSMNTPSRPSASIRSRTTPRIRSLSGTARLRSAGLRCAGDRALHRAPSRTAGSCGRSRAGPFANPRGRARRARRAPLPPGRRILSHAPRRGAHRGAADCPGTHAAWICTRCAWRRSSSTSSRRHIAPACGTSFSMPARSSIMA